MNHSASIARRSTEGTQECTMNNVPRGEYSKIPHLTACEVRDYYEMIIGIYFLITVTSPVGPSLMMLEGLWGLCS